MFRVRYYDDVIHPDHFRGWLGFWIRVLNTIRWRLETLVQRLVLRYMAKTTNLPKERHAELSKVFDLDVAAERLEKQRTSPLFERLEPPSTTPITRSERYVDGRQKSALDVAATVDKDLPVRPRRIDNMIAIYGGPGRDRHYGRGRQFQLGEDAFEPLEVPEDE